MRRQTDGSIKMKWGDVEHGFEKVAGFEKEVEHVE